MIKSSVINDIKIESLDNDIKYIKVEIDDVEECQEDFYNSPGALELKIYALHSDNDKYPELIRDNYFDPDYDTVVSLLRETMSLLDNAKFRLRYSIVVFKMFCELMLIHDDYVDYIGEDIILQWVCKNKNYYATSIMENEWCVEIMYDRLHERFKDNPSWEEPFRQIDEKIAPTRCLRLLHDSNY